MPSGVLKDLVEMDFREVDDHLNLICRAKLIKGDYVVVQNESNTIRVKGIVVEVDYLNFIEAVNESEMVIKISHVMQVEHCKGKNERH